ncbi:uncharacterized protein NEMAJ01_1117 [Nematocida major]|uniref:uncharacterized protein n=1 Tax=Nematocida major TaxID=1912982 RepID=UPI002007FF48|nr:uncharacterized protein NEMAJ01_1117 [Nematocida major]KAH9386221.1 hypothetical protein NEMAJ01_1117 [Nematocida major]
MAHISNRVLTAGACSFILISILPKLDASVNLYSLLAIVCTSYWVGETPFKSLIVLYFLLNSHDIFFIMHRGHVLLLHSFLHCTDIPILTDVSHGRALYRSIKSKSVIPICISMAITAGWACFVYRQEGIGSTPLMSSSVISLHSNSVYMSTMQDYYGASQNKHGSGNRRVVGVPKKSLTTEWRILLDGGNPLPTLRITSGSYVYLQDVRTGEYLHTFDVASPLTTSNQEVSTVPTHSSNNRFVIINKEGDISRKTPMHSDEDFYLKHVDTGVFLRVLKRNVPGGYEINGQKEAGGSKHIGGRNCLWTGIEMEANPSAAARIKKAAAHVYKCVKMHMLSTKAEKKQESAERKARVGIYQYIYSHNMVLYGLLFLLSAARGLCLGGHLLEQTCSCALDLLESVILGKNVQEVLYSAGIIGIRKGIHIHMLVREFAGRRKIKNE